MKFLHLSDLHIGKNVNGFSMLEEQKHIFEQVIRCIKSERPDAVIIAGDIYDRAIPGVEAVRLFDDLLTELAHEDVTVLLISGNHDSPERLGYASRLLAEKQLFMCGAFEGKPRQVILSDRYGEVNFWLLPFIKPTSVRGMFGEAEIESYDETISAALEAAKIDYDTRNVLVSHQFYTKRGCIPIRSESELNPVGGLDAVDAELVGWFDYVALGHLHGRQTAGASHILYAGSPLKYSFSEQHQKKSMTLVELHEKGRLEITAVPLVPLRDLREIKGELNWLLSPETAGSGDCEDYLRVVLTDEEELIDPLGKLRSVYPNVMCLDFENSRTGIELGHIASDIGMTEALSPYDLFQEFFLEVQGSAMTSKQTKIVRDLLEMEDEQ